MAVVSGGLLAAPPLAAEAQQPPRTLKIGFLTGAGEHFAAFQEGLRTHGYAEGRNVIIEVRSAGADNGRFPGFAAELVGSNVDIIVAATTPAALAAKKATSTIPIVFLAVGDPIGSGLVPSLARPGGNVTGISQASAEGLPAKRLEFLKVAAPNISRLAILWVVTNPSNRVQIEPLERAARTLGMKAQSLGLRDSSELPAAFATIGKQRADSLLVFPDLLTFAYLQRIVEFAAKSRRPAVYAAREFVEAGGLVSYGIDFTEVNRAAAAYVAKIFKGAKPGDLPVEQATKFELVINLKTAKALGLTIPQSLLQRADEVIQ